MKEKLTAFLEGEYMDNYYEVKMVIDDPIDFGKWLKNRDTCLINFVLDIVGEEMEKKEMKETVPYTDGTVQEFETGYVDLDDIKQILTNLKI